MLWLKSCPRCRTGGVVLNADGYGAYIECLQCGYMKDVDKQSVAPGVSQLLRNGEAEPVRETRPMAQ